MKTTSKKYSQSRFSALAIVISVIAVVAILAVVTMYLPKNSQQSPTTYTNNQTPSSTVPGIDKVDVSINGSKYSFYYPQGYVKYDKKVSQTTLYDYVKQNGTTNTPEITLGMTPHTTQGATMTSANCATLLKQTTTIIGANDPNAKSEAINDTNSQGCDFMFTVNPGSPDPQVQHYRTLQFKTGSDYNSYQVTSYYYQTSTSQEDKNNLDLAVKNFTLK